MIQSMTGFFSTSALNPCGRVVWELRSLNHRYLDFQCRLPNGFSPVEIELRKKTAETFYRGKIEATLHFVADKAVSELFSVNECLVKGLQEFAQKISAIIGEKSNSLRTTDILRWPGVLQENGEVSAETHSFIIKSFEQALKGLKEARIEEGRRIKTVLLDHLQQLQSFVATIQKLAPNLQENYKNRLLNHFKEVNITLETSRLEQEVVLAAQKMDVTEEVDRLTMHLAEVKKILEQGKEVGKRLDFLMQELNREANTIAAKSPNAELAHYAVEIKVHIEKMREQIQNIE